MTAEINLLPWRAKLRFRKIFYFRVLLLAFIGVAVLVLLLRHVQLKQKINNTVKLVHLLQLQQDQITKQVHGEEQRQQQRQRWQQVANYMERLGSEQWKFVQIFEVLHKSMPNNLYLEQLSIKQQEVKINGWTAMLADLKQFIESISYLKVGIPVIQKISRQNDGYSFVVIWRRQ